MVDPTGVYVIVLLLGVLFVFLLQVALLRWIFRVNRIVRLLECIEARLSGAEPPAAAPSPLRWDLATDPKTETADKRFNPPTH